MIVTLKNISKTFGDRTIISPLNLTFNSEKTTILLGSSGCGKSTLLRIIIGLVSPSEGSIQFGNETLQNNNAEILRRRVGYVIQDGGLFPHLNAEDNIALQSRFLNVPKKHIQKKMHELCELVQLPKYILNHYPKELSGGQKQRIGIMRALMLDPECILLDEPLGALDPIIRHELQLQLKHIFTYLKKTVIMVTHDLHEAAFLGDHIVIMHKGVVVQKGTYQELLKFPANEFVKDFIKFQETPVIA